MKVLQVLLLVASSYNYATLAAESQWQPEVNVGGGEKLRFGAKINVHPTQQTVATVASNANNQRVTTRRQFTYPTPASRTNSLRSFDSNEAPRVQIIKQYDIPIVSKTVPTPARSRHQTLNKGQPFHKPNKSSDYAGDVSHEASIEFLPKRPNQSQERRDHEEPAVVGSRPPQKSSHHYNSRGRLRKTSSTTTTTTTTTTPRPNLFGNIFGLFSPNLWNFSSPPTQATTTTTTPKPTTTRTSSRAARRPPKKFTISNASFVTSSEEKLHYRKPKTTTTTTERPTKPTTRTTSTNGPFRIALPTLNLYNAEAQKDPAKEKEKRTAAQNLRARFVCPRESEVRFQLFPKICTIDEDCSIWNRDELCCDIFGSKSCVSGVPKPLEETSHEPILGLIQRKCPSRPLAELWWDVKECHTDMDCWPRVCCPDGRRRYCRTSQPELETVPVPVKRSINYLSEYLECTAPPPPIFDLHPKACTSTFDCFPNVCCQEAGLRHCRPPKKSVLTLMTNFLNVDFVKRITQNIVIK